MAVIKLEALRELGRLIECEVPALKGRICADQASAGHDLEFPSLSITVERSRYFPDQEDEHFSPCPTVLVVDVGRHVQDVRIRLGAATTGQRAQLEQDILNLFLADEGHPGILHAQLTACPEFGPFTAAWELEEATWLNERAFSRELYSELKVTGTLPALATRRGVYTMAQIQLGVSIGPLVEPTDDPPDFDATDILTVNEDGTFTPA